MNDNFLLSWMDGLLRWLGISGATDSNRSVAASVVVILCCVLFWRGVRYLLLRGARLSKRIDTPQLAIITKPENIEKVARAIALLTFYTLMPLALDESTRVGIVVKKALDITLVWMFASLLNTAVRTLFLVIYHRRKSKNAPLKGIMQVVQIIVWCVAAIIIIAILIDRSPAKLFTGLGASLAVLSFVFKDPILNLVSGILLSSDKMVKVGDWIEMPSVGIDGEVIDMTLNTVKVKGWDNTISNVSPYTLTSGTFKNWEGMVASGGRRIARMVEIDINSVKFCPPELLERLAKLPALQHLVGTEDATANGQQTTNLELFRHYLEHYIEHQPWLNASMTHMVRHLQSSETGVPIQVYAFTNTTAWIEYERIQAALFEHIMAIAPLFELRIFQRPSGSDLDKIGAVDKIF